MTVMKWQWSVVCCGIWGDYGGPQRCPGTWWGWGCHCPVSQAQSSDGTSTGVNGDALGSVGRHCAHTCDELPGISSRHPIPCSSHLLVPRHSFPSARSHPDTVPAPLFPCAMKTQPWALSLSPLSPLIDAAGWEPLGHFWHTVPAEES